MHAHMHMCLYIYKQKYRKYVFNKKKKKLRRKTLDYILEYLLELKTSNKIKINDDKRLMN